MNLKQFSSMKILNHMALAEAVVRGDNPWPVSFEIDPSNSCNHDCVWCMYEEFMHEEKGMLAPDVFARIVDEVLELGTKSITFTGGGEPLVNPQTVKLIPKIREHGCSVALITNGGLLDEEKCRTIVEHCSYVRVSVDAGCESTHQALHRPKNPKKDGYSRILANLSRMAALKKEVGSDLTIGVGFLVHPGNIQEVFSLVSKAKETGVNYVQIRPVCNLGTEDRRMIIAESKKQIEHSLKLIDNEFHVFPLLHRFDELMALERPYNRCYGHGLIGTIGADAKVYLCCQLKGEKQFMLGDLKRESFAEIWHGERRREVIAKLDVNQCPPCRYSKYNEILEYIADKEKPHTEFL